MYIYTDTYSYANILFCTFPTKNKNNGSEYLLRYLQKLKFKYFDIRLLKERHKDPWPPPLFVKS